MYNVYLIINTQNGKGYVGITSRTIEERFSAHVERAKRQSKNLFHCALRKYGPENFITCLLESEVPFEDGASKEAYYIQKYNTYYINKKGYNMTFGGSGTLGYVFTEEVKEKMAEAGRRRIHSPERNKKIQIAMTGRDYKQEWKEALKRSIGDRTGSKNPFYGRQHSEATKEKISMANTGRGHTEEFRQMMSEVHKGVPHSETQIQKMRENSPHNHAVCQYNTCMEFVAEFPSLKEAQRQTGIAYQEIGKCCRGHL